jgi:hypothetical protein
MEQLDELHEGVSQSLSVTQARETTAQQRRATALRIGSLAAAGHQAAGELEEHFPQMARYIHDAASGFEHISGFLRDPNLDEVANFFGDLGRRQPAAVIAAAFVVAVALSWFLRSSGDTSDSFAADSRGGSAYGVH